MQMKQVIQLHRKDSDCNASFCNDTVLFTPSVKSKNNQEVPEYICTIILWCAIGEIKKCCMYSKNVSNDCASE